MLENITPALIKRLRFRSDMSRTRFAALIGVTPNTLTNYEKGNTRPDPETERKMIQASRCSDLELAEIVCEVVSEQFGFRVAITEGERGYRPTTALAAAEQIRRHFDDELTTSERRALDNKLHTAQLAQLLCERHFADLSEYAADCRAAAETRRRSADDRETQETRALKQGATGPAMVAGPVFHNAGAGRCAGSK